MINTKSAKLFCKDDISLIENYDTAIADTTQMWVCHHKAGILSCGRFSRKILKQFSLYYNRPASELIFVLRSEHMCMHMKGINRSDEHRKKLGESVSKALTGKKKTLAHVNAVATANKKRIAQYTKSGEFVREWPSAKDAQRELGITRCHICNCCKGKRKSAGGYIWKYANI